jgi:hypothetical protein
MRLTRDSISRDFRRMSSSSFLASAMVRLFLKSSLFKERFWLARRKDLADVSPSCAYQNCSDKDVVKIVVVLQE